MSATASYSLGFVCVIVMIVMLSAVTGHPTKYTLPQGLTCSDNPPIHSYHIHVLYWGFNKNHTDGALKLLDNFQRHFNLRDCPNDDLFHQPYSCLFGPDPEPAGPFLTAQWSAFALPTGTPSLGDLHGYLLQNRNSYNGGFSYDVFLHTNTGCETFDHTRWASWSGQVWGIDASIFGHDSPDKL